MSFGDWESNPFKEFFDGTREARREAEAALAEQERREERRADAETRRAWASSPLTQELLLSIHSYDSGAKTPDAQRDAAACFWYRRALEDVLQVLDGLMPAAEGDE